MKSIHETLSSRVVYENKHLELKVDKVRLPNGYVFDQVYFVKPGQNSVGIVAVENNSTYLVRQYRYTARQWMWQIPMGTSRKKSPLACAKQELHEETGLKAKKWQKIGSIRPEPGMLIQSTTIYLARDLAKGKLAPEEEEYGMRARKFSFDQIEEMMRKGKITCGYTLSAWLLFRLTNDYLDKQKGNSSK